MLGQVSRSNSRRLVANGAVEGPQRYFPYMQRLDLFDPTDGLDRGASRWKEGLWWLVKTWFFQSGLPWPRSLKRGLLRAFGANVGVGVVIKPRVTIHFPWKLTLGEHVWIGEEVFILNFEAVEIGANACISQRAFLCGGNHDFRHPQFRYRNGPITVGSGAWVCAGVFVAAGSHIGEQTVVTVNSVVQGDLPPNYVCGGQPACPIKPRWPESTPSPLA